MKKVNLLGILGMIVLLGVGTTACSSSTNSDNDESQYKTEQDDSTTKDNDTNDESKINAAIAKDLKLDKGWADGSLDEDGNPTDNGTPQDDFAWAVFIEKIEYSSDNLRIYVNNGFKNLNDNERQVAIESAMRASYSGINKYKKMEQEQIKSGLYTEIYMGDTSIGHSKISNHSQFSWDE